MTINSPETITAPKLDSQEAKLLTIALNILDWDKSELEHYIGGKDLAALSYAELEDLFFKLHSRVIATPALGTSHKDYWQALNAVYHPYRDIAINKIGKPDDEFEYPDHCEPMEPLAWYHAG